MEHKEYFYAVLLSVIVKKGSNFAFVSLLSRNYPTVSRLLGIEIFFPPFPRLLKDIEIDVDGLISDIYKDKREEEGQLEEAAQVPDYKRVGAHPSPRQAQDGKHLLC